MNTALHNTKNITRTLSLGALVLIVACVALYLYFVNKTVFNVVHRAQAEKSIAAIGGELSTLESSYVAEKNKITLPLAYQEGFQDVPNAEFVTQKSGGLTFGVTTLSQ